MITPDTKWSQRLLNICFIVLITYFSVACIGKAHEIYVRVIAIDNLQERIDQLEKNRTKAFKIRSIHLCGPAQSRDDAAL